MQRICHLDDHPSKPTIHIVGDMTLPDKDLPLIYTLKHEELGILLSPFPKYPKHNLLSPQENSQVPSFLPSSSLLRFLPLHFTLDLHMS